MSGGSNAHGHPEVWAILTILTFPVVLLSMDALEFSGLWPFLFALLATSVVLALEVLVRGRLWLFETGFIEHIGHPDTPLRLAVFLAACLFVLETALLLVLATNRKADAVLLGFIARRQCATRGDDAAKGLCQFLSRPAIQKGETTTGDAASFATRVQATKLWFPDEPLVTCSDRKIAGSELTNGRARYAALVRCTAWHIDEQNILKSKRSITRFVGASLLKREDGLYRVEAWSDDYANSNWSSALGDIADHTRDTAQSFAFLPDFMTVLEAENLGQAQQILSK